MSDQQTVTHLKLHDVQEHACNQCKLDAQIMASFEVSQQPSEEEFCYELCFYLENAGEPVVWIEPEEIDFFPAELKESTKKKPVGKNWTGAEAIKLSPGEKKASRISFTLSRVNTDQEYHIIIRFRDEEEKAYLQKFVIGTRIGQEDSDEIETRYILSDDAQEA